MIKTKSHGWVLALLVVISLSACSNIFRGGDRDTANIEADREVETQGRPQRLRDLFLTQNSSTELKANRFIWKATLEVLDFMPIEEVDPFTGIIQFGWATPPGGTREYQATAVVSDPSLDARSLQVTFRTRSGVVDPDLNIEIENAILARARQLKIEELGF